MKKNYILFIFLFALSLSIHAQEKYGMSLKVGSAVPMLSFSDIYDANISAEIGLVMPFSKNLQFTLSTGYYKWNLNNAKFNSVNDNTQIDYYDIEAPIDAFPLTIGLRYKLLDSKAMPYLIGEFGFYYYTQKLSGSYIQNDVTYPAPEMENSGFSTIFGFGFGFAYPFSETIYFDSAAKFNGALKSQKVDVPDDNNGLNSASNVSYFLTVMAGINIYFD